MLYEDSQNDIALCSKVFPNLGWVIESDSPNRVRYEGKSNTLVDVHVEGNLDGYTAQVTINKTVVIIESARAMPSLLSVLQEIKEEWQSMSEVMQ